MSAVTEPEPPYHLSDWFWSVVEDERPIRELLDAMPVEDLLRFHYELEDAVAEFQDERFYGYITSDSEDGAIDVANWAVSQGRTYYERVFEHPEELPWNVERYPTSRLTDGITLVVFYDRTGDYPPYRED